MVSACCILPSVSSILVRALVLSFNLVVMLSILVSLSDRPCDNFSWERKLSFSCRSISMVCLVMLRCFHAGVRTSARTRT